MPGPTILMRTSDRELRLMRELVLGAIERGLDWRHAGLGVAQAYLLEGETDELRVHIWDPSLRHAGIEESGLCHDHRFDLLSTVLVGSLQQVEVSLKPDPEGDWTPREITHAREAKKTAGTFDSAPGEQSGWFQRSDTVVLVPTGMQYFFPRGAFHETHFGAGLTVTLIEKRKQRSDVKARILERRGVPLVAAFANTREPSELSYVVDGARLALRRELGL